MGVLVETQVVLSVLNLDTRVKNASGLKGREMEVLEDSPCLCLGKMILSVKSGSPVIQQAYLERPTSVDCFWQTEMKKQFSNSF